VTFYLEILKELYAVNTGYGQKNSVSVANSEVHSFMIEDFTIKGNRLFLFSKRKKKINIKLFCFNPLRALNYEEKQHQ